MKICEKKCRGQGLIIGVEYQKKYYLKVSYLFCGIEISYLSKYLFLKNNILHLAVHFLQIYE
jgi:hypothetical protein